MLETSYHVSNNSDDQNDNSNSSDADFAEIKKAADKAAEDQFEQLVSHVLQSVIVTGNAYQYKKEENEMQHMANSSFSRADSHA